MFVCLIEPRFLFYTVWRDPRVETVPVSSSMRALPDCFCGCWMRAKIDEPGCQRSSLTINIVNHYRGALADRQPLNFAFA